MDSFATFHPAHGALAGVLVYAVTGKPLPALAVGGGLYAYMAMYGHGLPGSAAAAASSARSIDSSHGPLHPTIFKALG